MSTTGCVSIVLVLLCALALAEPAIPRAQRNDEYFSPKNKRDWFIIAQNSKSTDCFFKGYKPNGPIVDIADIKSPKATLGAKSGLAKILSGAKKMGQGAAVVMHAMKFSAFLMKKAPMLGPALGVFSAMTGFINPAPTAQDILKSVNTAVDKLTSEVNQKLDQMKGYVDSKVAKLEKDLIMGEYATSFRLWANCINEPTEAKVKECQQDAVKHITAKRPKFTPLSFELKSLGGSKKVSFEKVRKLEAYMLAFRDYANLVVMQLTPLLMYYCVNKKNAPYASHYCDQYSNSLKTEAQFFIDYANQAVRVIKEGHWGTAKRGACLNTVKCDGQKQVREGFWNAHTANTQLCRCEIESSNTKKYCEIKFTIRVDNQRVYNMYNYPGVSGFANGGKEYGSRVLATLASDYQVKNHKIMDKYWQNEILAYTPEWQNAITLADELKAKNPKRVGDEPSMDYSDSFEDRLTQSGYVAVPDDEDSFEDNEDSYDEIYDSEVAERKEKDEDEDEE